MGIERSVSTWNYQAVAICPDQLKVAAASDSRRREEQVAIGDRTRQTFFATDNSGGPGGQTFFCNLNQLLLQVVLQHEARW